LRIAGETFARGGDDAEGTLIGLVAQGIGCGALEFADEVIGVGVNDAFCIGAWEISFWAEGGSVGAFCGVQDAVIADDEGAAAGDATKDGLGGADEGGLVGTEHGEAVAGEFSAGSKGRGDVGEVVGGGVGERAEFWDAVIIAVEGAGEFKKSLGEGDLAELLDGGAFVAGDGAGGGGGKKPPAGEGGEDDEPGKADIDGEVSAADVLDVAAAAAENADGDEAEDEASEPAEAEEEWAEDTEDEGDEGHEAGAGGMGGLDGSDEGAGSEGGALIGAAIGAEVSGGNGAVAAPAGRGWAGGEAGLGTAGGREILDRFCGRGLAGFDEVEEDVDGAGGEDGTAVNAGIVDAFVADERALAGVEIDEEPSAGALFEFEVMWGDGGRVNNEIIIWGFAGGEAGRLELEDVFVVFVGIEDEADERHGEGYTIYDLRFTIYAA